MQLWKLKEGLKSIEIHSFRQIPLAISCSGIIHRVQSILKRQMLSLERHQINPITHCDKLNPISFNESMTREDTRLYGDHAGYILKCLAIYEVLNFLSE